MNILTSYKVSYYFGLAILVVVLCLFAPLLLFGQSTHKKHPLSRQDSANIDSHYAKYERFFAEGDRKEASRWINEIALTYWNHSYYHKAIEYYERSIELNEGVQNENGIAMLNNNLGMLYSDIGNFEKSLDNFQKTLAARKVNQEKHGMIAALINISVGLNNLNRYPESVTNLEEALIYARELNDADQMKSCYGMLAETHTKMGENANAMKYFELYRSFHEMLTRKTVWESKQETEEAQLKAALAEAEKRNKELELLAKDKILTEQEEQLSDLDSTQQELLENLSENELKIRLLEVEATNKSLAIEKAKLEKKQLDENLKATQLTRNLSIGATVLLLVIAILIFIGYRDKRKTNQLLIEKNENILQKTEEIRAQSEELRVINERLVELDGFKERMTGMIVHDLKNPLNTIIHLSKNKKENDLQPIYQSGKQMLNLVMNILDVQRFEEARLLANLQSLELTTPAKKAMNDISLMAQSKSIGISNYSPAHLNVEADPDLIERVFLNLLINAVKYTPNNGKVEIKVAEHEKRAKVMVVDNGEGIPKAQQGMLFQKFGQVSAKGIGANKSTGLGLFFCQTVIGAHQGEIGVESEAGKGSTFWFTLALAKDHVIPKEISDSPVTTETENQLLSKKSKTQLLPIIEQIRQYELYEASEINEILSGIETENEEIIRWKDEMKNAVFNFNTEKFEELINL